MNCDVGIVGGGVIGLACAWRLAQSGARVHLFERGQLAREATHAAAGMLAAQCEAAHHPPQNSHDGHKAMFDLCVQSRNLYPDFARELQTASDVDCELSLVGTPDDWRTPGILYLATDTDDPSPAAFAFQSTAGHRAEPIAWRNRAAWWLAEEGQVDNRQLARALELAARRCGVEIHQNAPVERIEKGALIVSGARVECEQILLCGGAWSSLLMPSMPDVRPIFGQMLSLQSDRLLDRIIYSSDVYLVPRRDGRLIVGATMEERGFNRTRTARGVQTLLGRALELVPELGDCELIDHWSGLRPCSRDGLPILGRSEIESVWIAGGHFRNGVLLAPITAQLMADAMRRGGEIPSAFRPSRASAA